jgi:eukaryotic-like serine/threonine-protein kinase
LAALSDSAAPRTFPGDERAVPVNNQLLHPDMSQLQAFARGELDAQQIEQIQRHLADCPSCCLALDEIPDDDLLDLVRRAGAGSDEVVGDHAIGDHAIGNEVLDDFVADSGETVAARKSQTSGEVDASDINEAVRNRSRPDGTTPAELPAELAEHARYRVVQCIGQGGMGEVYKAEHRLMQRWVALKVIHRELMDSPQAVERFHREVRAAAALTHPHIVAAYDAEQVQGVHFLAMEYVEGTDLAQVVQQRGPLPVQKACDYIRQAALGLQHAHERGMVHRDIKPHNLMLTSDGTVKILDFGLASLTEGAIDRSLPADQRGDLTAVGTIMGTPDYISPEQALDPSSVDIRSDLYSLGATFYYLLAGRPPFAEGSVMDKLKSHAQFDAERIDCLRLEVPAELADIIVRMLAKDPAQRFQTPAELATALSPFVDKHLAKPAVAAPARGWLARHRAAAAIAGLALLIVSLLVVYKLTNGSMSDTIRQPQPPPPPRPQFINSIITNSIDMKLAPILAGQFTRTSYRNRVHREHPVEIRQPFHMSVHEVTQQQYFQVMGRNPSAYAQWGHPQPGAHRDKVQGIDTQDFPVENVSWDEAQEFCRRLSDRPEERAAQRVYRLPTEAEWEYACRAGSETAYAFGDEIDASQAHTEYEPLQRPVAVGSFPANGFGLFDMHGNVAEWCADWFDLDYYLNAPSVDPTGPSSSRITVGGGRVVRGGSFLRPREATSGERSWRPPDLRTADLGFRVVCRLVPAPLALSQSEEVSP